MIFVRPWGADRAEELELGLRRLRVPRAGLEYLLEKLPRFQLLATGLGPDEVAFLRSLEDLATAPGREEFPRLVVGDKDRAFGAVLLSGRKDQCERLCREARSRGHGALAAAVEAAVATDRPRQLRLRQRKLELGTRSLIMGVVNVTPDSFSDGGRFLQADAAIAHGEALLAQGADLLDVGGESTRPGAPAVSLDEECARVLPVLRSLRARAPTAFLSVDTTKAEVARRALDEGVDLVNDASGLRFDRAMASTVAAQGAGLCVMHMRGTPATMQKDPQYVDVVEEVVHSLGASVDEARKEGLGAEQLLVDPGIGFGKTVEHNLFLLRRLGDLRVLGVPILVGTSRKSFLGAVTGKPVGERLFATLGSVAVVASLGGADIVRVHDVAATKDALAVVDAVRGAQGGGSHFEPRVPRGAV